MDVLLSLRLTLTSFMSKIQSIEALWLQGKHLKHISYSAYTVRLFNQ